MSIHSGSLVVFLGRGNSAAMAHGSPQKESSDAFHVHCQIFPYLPPTPELLEAIHKACDREIKAGACSTMAG